MLRPLIPILLGFSYLLFTSACTREQQLHGHWLLIDPKDDQTVIGTLDFFEDSLVIWNANIRHSGLEGWHLPSEQAIHFIEIEIGAIPYEWQAGQPFFYFFSEDSPTAAIPCDRNCQDMEAEYFLFDNLAIQLPRIRRPQVHQPETLYGHSSIYDGEVLLGPIKADRTQLFGDSIALQLGDKVTNETEIPLWHSYNLDMIPERLRPSQRYPILADQQVGIPRLNRLISAMQREGIENICLAFLIEESLEEERLNFLEVPIEQIDFTGALRVGDLTP